MAHVHARRRQPVAVPDSIQKENRPPPTGNAKRIVSISGIFDHAKKHRKAPEVRNVLSPRPAGISKVKATPGYFTGLVKGGSAVKSKVAEPGFFAKFRADCEKKPLGLDFSDPVADYREAANASFERRMAQWRKELGLRQKGLDINGRPMRKAPVPTQADIDALTKELEDLQRPIDDEVLDIHDPRTGGTKAQKLSETMEKLDQRLDKKFAQIRQLEAEQSRVDKEFEDLKKQVLGDAEDYKKTNADYEAQLAALQKEIEKVEATAKSELDDMKRKGRNAKKAFNAKIQALWDGINDYE